MYLAVVKELEIPFHPVIPLLLVITHNHSPSTGIIHILRQNHGNSPEDVEGEETHDGVVDQLDIA